MYSRKYKRIMIGLLALSFGLGFGYSTVIHDMCTPVKAAECKTVEREVISLDLENSITPPPVIVVEMISDEVQYETELTEYEKELIAKVVYAEAGNQDYVGKRLVADTILNRVNDPAFPDTVAGVIYQPHQFAHPAATYTPECYGAVEAECKERLDYDILWFCNYKYLPYGIPAYQHGAHYFTWRANNEQ